MGIEALIKAKWYAEGEQPGLKVDMADIEEAILQSFGLQGTPTLVWADATSVKVQATVDDIASVMMAGFPSVLHPGRFISGGLTDGKYRENTADVIMDFDLATNFWGNEKASQWYAIFAIAGNSDITFTIKAMPYLRVKSQAGQVISLGTNITPATGIGYGFTTDQLAGGAIYPISGASKGLLRSITANNNDNGTGGTITYGGSALTLAQGDWLAVLPPTNFRWIGDILNNPSSNIAKFFGNGDWIEWLELISITMSSAGVNENINFCSPLATTLKVGVAIPPDNRDNVYLAHPSVSSSVNAQKLTLHASTYPNTTHGILQTSMELCKIRLDWENYTASIGLTPIGYGYRSK